MRNVRFEIVKSTLASGEMPQMKITTTAENGNDRVGYLTPFRGYRFQVSSNKEGSGDCGSSEVIGLARVLFADYRGTEEHQGTWGYQSNTASSGIGYIVLESLAKDAIFRFTHGTWEIHDTETLYKFIELVAKYISSRVDAPEAYIESPYMIMEQYVQYCDE